MRHQNCTCGIDLFFSTSCFFVGCNRIYQGPIWLTEVLITLQLMVFTAENNVNTRRY